MRSQARPTPLFAAALFVAACGSSPNAPKDAGTRDGDAGTADGDARTADATAPVDGALDGDTGVERLDAPALEETSPAPATATARLTEIHSDVPVTVDVQADGSFFYFVSPGYVPNTPSFGNIYRLPRGGGTAELLVHDLAGLAQGQLRVAAGKLAYLTSNAIHVVELATGTDTAPIGDDPKNSAASPGYIEDVAFGDDGLYWLAGNGDNAAGGKETWVERRLSTGTASETLAPGVPPFAGQMVVSGGQAFGQAGIENNGVFTIWSWSAGAASAKVLVDDTALMFGRPSDLPVDDQFVYFMPATADRLQRLPRAGGTVETLASWQQAHQRTTPTPVLYGRYVLWSEENSGWFAVDKAGGAPIEIESLACATPFLVGQNLFCVNGVQLFAVSIAGLAPWATGSDGGADASGD